VFKWPINCLIAADTSALPVALTIAAKFNLILKTASSVKENDVPLYITFVWNSSSAGKSLYNADVFFVTRSRLCTQENSIEMCFSV
jgi:hypothetical protein